MSSNSGTAAASERSSTVQSAVQRTSSSKLGYHQHLDLAVSYALYVLVAPILAALVLHLSRHTSASLDGIIASARSMVTVAVVAAVLVVLAASVYLMRRPRAVYLLDMACYKPGAEHAVTRETFMRLVAGHGTFSDDSLAFQRKILERSGLGQGTYLPKALTRSPPSPCLAEARAEAEAVMFGAVDQVLAKTTGVFVGRAVADSIGIVIVNSGLFSPTPSLSAMIVNRYKLREDVCSYNLGGMGCSASLIAVDLAKQLLQATTTTHRNTYALVVSLEALAGSAYCGNARSMLVPNCIFRMGGAAVLLTNRRADRRQAKYQLLHTVRTHRGADDRAYRCVYQQEDESGHLGVALSKDLMAVAAEALRANIATLAPLVLPVSEKMALLLASLAGRARKVVLGARSVRHYGYVPDFKTAFEHFCIHAGGRAVLDTVERSLGLTAWHMEPSRMTLYRWGNTSSSSLWYELAYTEAQGRVRRGHRVCQIAFGSGFKCNSAVWRALRTIDPAMESAAGGNPWVEEIHKFPVEVPQVERVHVAMAS